MLLPICLWLPAQTEFALSPYSFSSSYRPLAYGGSLPRGGQFFRTLDTRDRLAALHRSAYDGPENSPTEMSY